jgi:hypothetical protein
LDFVSKWHIGCRPDFLSAFRDSHTTGQGSWV